MVGGMVKGFLLFSMSFCNLGCDILFVYRFAQVCLCVCDFVVNISIMVDYECSLKRIRGCLAGNKLCLVMLQKKQKGSRKQEHFEASSLITSHPHSSTALSYIHSAIIHTQRCYQQRYHQHDTGESC